MIETPEGCETQSVFAAASPKMSALIAAKDWSETPVGDRSGWSPALRTILDVSLANRFPVVFWWGPSYVQFYNDPYSAILGEKHPRSLGQSVYDCWAEIWHVIGPQIESVFRGGPSTWNEDLLLEMNRHGFLEETYFTFSYSTLPDPSVPGGIGGVLGTVQETTEKVIGERRMRLLRDLAARGTEAKTVAEECSVAVQTLDRYSSDVPFSRIYLLDADKRIARLEATGGASQANAPSAAIDIRDDGLWPLRSVMSSGSLQIVHDASGDAVVAPIPSSTTTEIAGFLIAGANPRRPVDENCRDFFGLVAAQIGTAIAGARAYEEERRRAEALAEIDRAKNVFFSNVSHEFRTPLTLMLGPLGELAKDADDEHKPMVEAAYRNSLRLLKLVNTLLEFSRLEAGRVDAAFAQTNLSALTADLCSVFRSAIEAAGLEFRVDIDLADEAYVDRAMWEKIVLNLLSNALKFTLEGGVRVALARSGDAAELRVEDTGVGIPDAEVPHVFERFRRVRGAKARSHEGSGIGLALVKDLVELHGGSIAVRSRVGEGTAFTVRVPLGRSHLDAASVVAAPVEQHSSAIVEQYLAEVDSTILRAGTEAPPVSGTSTHRPRVLLADDNGDLRDYVRRILAPEYDVVAVRNGLQALQAARERHVDLIISDVMMPEMDGLQLLEAVRKEAQLSTTPFILLSARAGGESALEGLTRGADDYVSKPFSSEDLLARVRANLKAASVRDEAWNISQRRFQEFADQLPVMVWQQDPSGAVCFTNAAWHAITGLPRETSSLTSDAWKSVVHPDDYDRVVGIMSRAIDERAGYSFEYRVKAASAGDEGYRWYTAGAFTQWDDDVFLGWTGYVVDIHDSRVREEIERRLRTDATQRERAFHALAEAIPVIVWSADSSGWLDWYNNRWYEYTGQTPQEAAGWGWQAAHHPEDFPRVMEEWPRSIATGEPFEMEFRLRRRDGAFRWFLTRAKPERDQHGRVVRWYGSNVDIQAQKETLEQSKRIAETLQGVFLPGALPHTDKVRFDAVYVAAERDALIGGDWFDAAQLPDGRFLISIGDVAGHGLDASVIAGTLRQAIMAFGLTNDNPARILRHANDIVRFQYPDKYATAFVGILDAECTKLSYASAGHPAPLLAAKHGTGVRPLQLGGIPLGVQADVVSVSRTASIERDAVLVFYTDGLTEFARDIDAAEKALEAAAARLAGDAEAPSPAAAIRDAVLGDRRPPDDVAILVAQFSKVDKEALRAHHPGVIKEWRFHSSDAYTARASRHELMQFIRGFTADAEALSTAELILGEILANTVEHAPGLVQIRIDWRGEKPVVTARDAGSGFAPVANDLPSNILDESGRGLFLIRSLAESVSIRPAPGYGTELEVVLPLRRLSDTA